MTLENILFSKSKNYFMWKIIELTLRRVFFFFFKSQKPFLKIIPHKKTYFLLPKFLQKKPWKWIKIKASKLELKKKKTSISQKIKKYKEKQQCKKKIKTENHN